MNKIISQGELEKIYRHELKKVGGKSQLEKIRSEKRFGNAEDNRRSIFLCHSHLDKTIVDKILLLFNNLQINMYVDWMDDGLPKVTSKDTATIIKSKIDNTHKFLFLATYNALRSRWCNWELGLAYSSKGESDFAILPIESKGGKWLGNEYLQLYPEFRVDIEQIDRINVSDIKISFMVKT